MLSSCGYCKYEIVTTLRPFLMFVDFERRWQVNNAEWIMVVQRVNTNPTLNLDAVQ